MAIQDFTAGQILTAAQMDALQANDYNQTVSTKTDSYVLVAADKGTRLVMNAGTAKTFTVNSGLFAAGDTLFIQNIGVGTATITAGTATVTTAGSLALAQWGGGTLYFTSASAAIFFSGGGGANYGTATGGIGSPTSVTIGGINYQYLQFNATGTLTVTKAGLFDVLLFGGGAASPQTTIPMGGAGGGGISQQTIYLDANATVTIGGGGSTYTVSTEYQFGAGSSTQIGAIPTAIAALGGTSNMSSATGKGILFTGGGMGSYAGQTNTGVDSIQGFKGGNSSGVANGAGGGGAAQAGGNGSGSVGGTGGNGYDVSAFIGSTALGKGAGGGGSGTVAGGTAGLGGVAGSTGAGIAGPANSAAGAGGSNNAAGANGGSGIVYVRFKV